MPSISVVIPCHNEAKRLPALLAALHGQTHPADEIMIVNSASTDNTVQVARNLAQQYALPLRVVDNPRATIPSSLNCGMSAVQSDIIVRLDGHCIPRPAYLEESLKALLALEARGTWGNVGGQWQVSPGSTTPIAKAIAYAVTTPLGAGDASYRIGGQAGNVETVPFGCFRKQMWQKLGGYDEKLLSNEDYEYNTRIIQAGGSVWFTPAVQAEYFARTTLPELWKQYARYGFWKAQMLKIHLNSLRMRQLIPALWSLIAPCLLLVALASGMGWLPIPVICTGGSIAILGLYLLALVGYSLWGVSKRKISGAEACCLPWVYACIHFAWGWNFWRGVFFYARQA
ncbi:MAG TPA: glycosyltransferase family 2 protein [Anaerolineales bacterium]|nr:glycosyltransferase family 2 protein [Anaerolineales bacterium]